MNAKNRLLELSGMDSETYDRILLGEPEISTMTAKLEGLRALSTDTTSNPFCEKMFNTDRENIICKYCYSQKMLRGFRKNNVPKLQRNSVILSDSILPPNKIPNILDAYFRFSAHGELINSIHLRNLILICLRNPHCTFSLWTKRKDIVKRVFDKQSKPENLILIYSNPKISDVMPEPPKGFDKTFNNVLPDDAQNDSVKVNCYKQCKDCLLCYKNNTTATIVEKVKRMGSKPKPKPKPKQNHMVAYFNPSESKYTAEVVGIYETLKGARIACKSLMRKHDKSEDGPNYSYTIEPTELLIDTVKR